jgi:hypothetical protein
MNEKECKSDILRVTFRPRKESLMTNFKVKYQDVPLLIKYLIKWVEEKNTVGI